MTTLEEYSMLYKDKAIASAKRMAFFQILGRFFKSAGVLSWLLNGPGLGPSRSAFTERVIEKTKELNEYYNEKVFDQLNLYQDNRDWLYERMKQRKPISHTTYPPEE